MQLLDDQEKKKKSMQIKIVFSVGLAAGLLVLTKSIVFFPLGAVMGYVLPSFLEKMNETKRRATIVKQLPDAIMLLTSCLKAGLSLNQSFEVLVKEMSGPIAEEFSSIVKSLRVGVSIEDSFVNLHKKLNLEELSFVFSAILIARETGGDLPNVLTKLVDTLRDRKKLKESIDTYTIQGRAQAFIMGLIPIAFVAMTVQQDKNHFDIMFQTDIGKALMVAAAVLQVLAVFVIIKTSQIKI